MHRADFFSIRAPMEQGVENCGEGPLLNSKSTQGEPVSATKQHSNDIKEICVRESLLVEESITGIELEVYAEDISEARQLDIIHEGNDISEPENKLQKIHSPKESSEDRPANTCDIICPEYTTGTEKGICTPVTFTLSMPDTHSDTQDQCGSEQDNEYTDAVNDTKCAQIPEEFSQTSVVINEEVMLIPECGMETCQQFQLPGEVDPSSVLVKDEVMLIPKCRTEAFQQIQLPGKDVQSSMPLCQNVQLHTKFDKRDSTMIEEQREVVMENKCVIPPVEVQQAEDVTEVCTDTASMPRPAVSGCKPGWCGAMELVVLGMEEEKFSFIESDNELEDDKAIEPVVLSSVGMEEEKFSFIESDNELEDDKAIEPVVLSSVGMEEEKFSFIESDNVQEEKFSFIESDNELEDDKAIEPVVLSSVGMEEEKFSFIESDNEPEDDKDSKQDGCEELNDSKESQWETSIVESEGSSKKGELPFTISADVCDGISGNQQDCIGMSRYKEDTCDFPLVLEEEEKNEPASKRPRCSFGKHDECMMEPEIICEGQTTNELDTDDGSETLLQCLPTDSAMHWPALPNAPPCNQLYREDDDEGGSPPDDGGSSRTDPSTCHEQISISMSDCDNQLVPEEYSQVHNQLIPDQTFQEHKKSYSLYSDTHVGLDKSVSKISNSLDVSESLPSVMSLPFADQVIPQPRYSSCFEKREAMASKLSQTQVAPVSRQSDTFFRRPRLRLGLSKKQKTKRLHIN